MTSSQFLPVYHSREYWEAAPGIRKLVDQEFFRRKKEELNERLELSRVGATERRV